MQKKFKKNDLSSVSNENHSPECWGKYEQSQKCPACEFKRSCYFSKKNSMEQEKKDNEFAGYREFDDARKVTVISPEKRTFKLPDGRIIEPSEINLACIIWALQFGSENRGAAIALALKLSGAKSITDIARVTGRSKQAEHKNIARELGVGQKKASDSKLLKLTPREFEVYKLKLNGLSTREIAKKLEMTQPCVVYYCRSLARKRVCLSLFEAKNVKSFITSSSLK